MKKREPTIHIDPEIMGGTAVFIGTRVPLATLLDYLQAGQPLSEFLENFRPSRGSRSLPPWSKPRRRSSPERVLLDECLPNA